MTECASACRDAEALSSAVTARPASKVGILKTACAALYAAERASPSRYLAGTDRSQAPPPKLVSAQLSWHRDDGLVGIFEILRSVFRGGEGLAITALIRARIDRGRLLGGRLDFEFTPHDAIGKDLQRPAKICKAMRTTAGDLRKALQTAV